MFIRNDSDRQGLNVPKLLAKSELSYKDEDISQLKGATSVISTLSTSTGNRKKKHFTHRELENLFDNKPQALELSGE